MSYANNKIVHTFRSNYRRRKTKIHIYEHNIYVLRWRGYNLTKIGSIFNRNAKMLKLMVEKGFFFAFVLGAFYLFEYIVYYIQVNGQSVAMLNQMRMFFVCMESKYFKTGHVSEKKLHELPMYIYTMHIY